MKTNIVDFLGRHVIQHVTACVWYDRWGRRFWRLLRTATWPKVVSPAGLPTRASSAGATW